MFWSTQTDDDDDDDDKEEEEELMIWRFLKQIRKTHTAMFMAELVTLFLRR